MIDTHISESGSPSGYVEEKQELLKWQFGLETRGGFQSYKEDNIHKTHQATGLTICCSKSQESQPHNWNVQCFA